jgi:XTP/dITP diphosphohydrolase
MSGSLISLLVSTKNMHKMREIRAILGPSFQVSDLSALATMPEIEETGETFEDNATLKAVAVSQIYDGWVIADDSGLEVDALGGAPGVYSARYSGKEATNAGNNALLLKNLESISGKDRKARFRCVIVLARAGRKVAVFSGAVEGIIVNQPKGAGGFGYDPLFVPQGFCETFGQLPAATKNRLSHRALALERLRDWGGWGGELREC